MSAQPLTPTPDLALLLASTQPPAEVLDTARRAADAGLAEVWLGEDYCYHGGVAVAGALLAHTDMEVGLGIAPVPGRHPAVLAMEIATLTALYPGRLHPGLGAGVNELLDELGLRRRSPLRSIRDGLTAVRALLAGERVALESEGFTLAGVTLEHPPAEVPPLYLGVSGPKSLRLSGEIADGTVLSVIAGPDYVRWARERVDEGGAGPEHRLVVYALCSIDPDPRRARELLRPLAGLYTLLGPRNPLTEVQGIADEAEALAALGIEEGAAQMPDRWLSDFNVCGTPAQCVEQITRLGQAGADVVALCFPPEETPAMLGLLADAVMPELERLGEGTAR
jgi:alkanesulfonate monooxygenase SsuD/methylene tetrahydromethanopterin reductase-like flavin-dependent oxidoreductase (luciferase family)